MQNPLTALASQLPTGKSSFLFSRSTAAFFTLSVLAGAGCHTNGPSASKSDPFAIKPQTAPAQPPKSQRSVNHYQAARDALAAGDMTKANLEVRLALQENSLDANSHFLLGCLLAKKGEQDQAIVGFQRAMDLDPANPDALYNLGTLLLERGETVSACRLLEYAVLIRPDHVPTYNNLAKAYFLAGLPELALAAYDEALRRAPSDATALKNRQRIVLAAGNLVGADLPPPPPAAEFAPVVRPVIAEDVEVNALRDLIRDLPHVKAERRGGRITLVGWTCGPKERAMLDRILGKPVVPVSANAPAPAGKPNDILDLTSDDSGDPQRMIEIDAVLFIVRKLNTTQIGFNFLKQINLQFNYFASDHTRDGTGFSAPGTIGAVGSLAQQGWLFGASADYVVNIANATDEHVAVLARPHLTALSGTPAKFLAGGEIVFEVSGLNSGDIKPYPTGTTIAVTPTLLRTLGEDGVPRVHVSVEAGRISALSLLDATPNQPTAFEKVNVASEAVLNIGQTLILSGLSQRESRTGHSGVPLLMDVPILKLLFSTNTTVVSDSAVIILLTPRDPAFWDERYEKATADFVEMRRALVRAKQGTPEDMKRFRERYPLGQRIAPSHFASHMFFLENSEIYRAVSGQDLSSEDLDLELLGPKRKK